MSKNTTPLRPRHATLINVQPAAAPRNATTKVHVVDTAPPKTLRISTEAGEAPGMRFNGIQQSSTHQIVNRNNVEIPGTRLGVKVQMWFNSGRANAIKEMVRYVNSETPNERHESNRQTL